MWTVAHLKCPENSDWLAVVRVDPDGNATLIRYLDDIPDDAEQEIDAVQQRWTTRSTWPRDQQIQEGARIRDYVKYPEEDPRFLGVKTQIDGNDVLLDPREVELVYRAE